MCCSTGCGCVGLKKKKCWSSLPLCHSEESLWSEGSLCVDVHGFTFSTSLINGQLWTQDTVESTECDNYTYDRFNSTDILYSQRRSWNQTIWTIINHQNSWRFIFCPSTKSVWCVYLTGDSQCVAQLGLPRPKLSKHLCDGARLDPTCRTDRKSRSLCHSSV